MTDLIPEGVTRLLLVEGPDDKQFFKRLLKHMQSKREIPFDLTCLKIRKFGGKNKLGAYLFELLQQPNFESVDKIWIVRDADFNESDPQRAVGAPKRALQNANSAIDNAYRESSRDIVPPVLRDFMSPTDGHPKLSFMVLPDSEKATEGSLETLLLRALRCDSMMPCVDEYLACVKKKHAESEVARNREDKSRISVLLSGKLILRELSRSKDSSRELPRFMFSMKWWDDSVFDDHAFDDAKAFLTQLLAP